MWKEYSLMQKSIMKKLMKSPGTLIHGILHLLNYKDNTKESKDLMTLKENYYLAEVDCECFYV